MERFVEECPLRDTSPSVAQCFEVTRPKLAAVVVSAEMPKLA